jgi:diguanylate cyclase (GGDEF)-like protein/PAS domain S-box-containing protein/hemerythrin-like metal-binding protein
MLIVAILLSVTCSHAVDSPAKTGAGKLLKTIIVNNYNPYTFINDKGEPDGFSVEIARAVAKAMNFELEIRVDKWDQALKELEAGRIDLLPMMAFSPERDKLFDFSVPHTIAYDSIFVKKGNSGLRTVKDLSGKTVIVMNRDAAHSYLLSSGLSKTMNLNLVDSLPEALKQLAAGRGDAAIMPKLVGIVTAKKLNLSDFEQSPQLIDVYTRPFSFAVKEGNQELLERINQGLNIIKSTGQYDAVYKKWFGAFEDQHLKLHTVIKYGSVAAVILFGFIVWSIILKRQVRAKTEYLRAEIKQRKKTEASLRESEDSFRLILENAPIGLTVMSPEGRFTLVNRSLCEIVGYEKEELEKLTFQEITYPDDLGSDLANVQLLLDGGIQSYTMEKRYIRKDRRIVWTQLTVSMVRDDAGTPLYFISQIEDITGRKQTESGVEESLRKLEALSTTDGLTGIANRRRFDEFLTQEHSRHARTKGKLSLILLDIDHFKLFNDKYGHVSGDACLRKIAKVLDDCANRPSDLVSRYGGEEFACVLPETEQRGALLLAEKIRQGIINLGIPHEWSDAADCVSASLGVVTVRCSAGDKVSDIVVKADELLYKAKSLGRNRVECGEIKPEQRDINLVQLVWQDSYCSGNQLIDTQHQSLFKDSNELLRAILESRPKDEISSVVTRLLYDISQHFHDEENILESIGFPGLKQHALEHTKLYNDGLELAQKFMTDSLHVGVVFEFLVYEVVKRHMLGADLEFFEYTGDAVSASQSSH